MTTTQPMRFLSQRAALELLRDEAQKALDLRNRCGAPVQGLTSLLVACPTSALRFIVHAATEGLASGEPPT